MKDGTMTTEKVLAAWRTLNQAKYQKLDDADKVKVWKATRALRPIAEKFDEDLKDAAKKLKPSEDFDERLAKAQKYEVMIKQPDLDAEQLPMGAAEYTNFIDEFHAYNKLVDEAMKEYAQQKVEIEVEPLSEESFAKLMASNDWTMAQVVSLDDILVE